MKRRPDFCMSGPLLRGGSCFLLFAGVDCVVLLAAALDWSRRGSLDPVRVLGLAD